MHACMYVCTYVNTYVRTYIHTYIHIYVYIYIYIYIYIYTHIYIYAYICICMHAYMHANLRSYRHTHMHTYVHTSDLHILRLPVSSDDHIFVLILPYVSSCYTRPRTTIYSDFHIRMPRAAEEEAPFWAVWEKAQPATAV